MIYMGKDSKKHRSALYIYTFIHMFTCVILKKKWYKGWSGQLPRPQFPHLGDGDDKREQHIAGSTPGRQQNST